MKESTMAGPAPGRAGSPTMAVPVVAKIPAPIVAPTPSAVRCHLLSVRLRPPRSAISSAQSSRDFRRKSGFMPGPRRERVSERDDGGRSAGDRQPRGGTRGVEPVGAHDVFQLPGVAPVGDFRSEHHAVDPPLLGHEEGNHDRLTPQAPRVIEGGKNLLPWARILGRDARRIGRRPRGGSRTRAGAGPGTWTGARTRPASGATPASAGDARRDARDDGVEGRRYRRRRSGSRYN